MSIEEIAALEAHPIFRLTDGFKEALEKHAHMDASLCVPVPMLCALAGALEIALPHLPAQSELRRNAREFLEIALPMLGRVDPRLEAYLSLTPAVEAHASQENEQKGSDQWN